VEATLEFTVYHLQFTVSFALLTECQSSLAEQRREFLTTNE